MKKSVCVSQKLYMYDLETAQKIILFLEMVQFNRKHNVLDNTDDNEP